MAILAAQPWRNYLYRGGEHRECPQRGCLYSLLVLSRVCVGIIARMVTARTAKASTLLSYHSILLFSLTSSPTHCTTTRFTITMQLPHCNTATLSNRYKSRAYRARAVRQPRALLKEFGTDVPPDVTVRVHDSTADLRYMVLPKRPEVCSTHVYHAYICVGRCDLYVYA